MHQEPIMNVAHLAHLEVLTPKPEESLRFFVDVLGMTESGRRGESVYLRAWDDYERYSLKLTGSSTSGLGHAAFRARSPRALERRVEALKGSGYEVGWHQGELGHGPAYQFRDPDGHLIELYFETEWYQAPTALRPALKNQAQRFPARGVNVRRLDHFNCLAVDVQANREFFERYLGFRLTERIVLNDGTEAGMWLTCTNKSYDFAYTREAHGVKGRFHHITYALDSREDILRAADIFLENGARRDRAAQARGAADLLPLRLRARRKPGRGGQRRRAPGAGARLEADYLDRGGAQERPGVGFENDRELPYPRHAAAARAPGERGGRGSGRSVRERDRIVTPTNKTALAISTHPGRRQRSSWQVPSLRKQRYPTGVF
jgi:catechol 2,3-dioxygenase